MPTIRIPPGVVQGESREHVPMRYYDCNLVRWQNGVMKPVGGWDRITQQPLASIPRAAVSWSDATFKKHLAIMCDSNVYREQNSVITEITPADWRSASDAQSARGYGSGDYGMADYGMDDEPRGGSVAANDREEAVFPVKFSLDNWNDELLFASSADGRVMVWDPDTPDVAAAPSANAPTLIQSFIVTDEHHLMTFGGDGVPNRVAWSDQNNRIGFDYANVTGQAGFFDLEGGGAITTAIKIPGGILVFTTRNVWLGRYLGQPYFYGFTKIAEKCAPISPHAVAVGGSRAFWLGRQSFWKFEGGQITQLVCDLGITVFEEIDRDIAPMRVTAGFNGVYPEIWFCYPARGQNIPDPENNRYVIFNYVENWWAPGTLARTFLASSLTDDTPLGGDVYGHVFKHEQGYKDEGRERGADVWAEIGTLSFDDGVNNYAVTQCEAGPGRVSPDHVQFTFSYASSRGNTRHELGPFVPSPQGKFSPRFTAADFSMRIEGRIDAPWSLGTFVFDAIKRGRAR